MVTAARRVLVVAAVAGAVCAAAAGGGATYRNPVHDGNFPDPFVLRAGGTYYAYATNDEDGNVQTLRSRDLVHWSKGPDALPALGRWAYAGKTWAPEVARIGPRRYVLYYTANGKNYGTQCVGRAVSSAPRGPFVDRAREPLVCQRLEGGSIDPSPFRDRDGTLYLLWKNDGNCCGHDTYIYAQRLTPDGLRLVGKRGRLVKQDVLWELPLVEAPTMWRSGGRYYLFFSGNAFDTGAYAVGYATCRAPLGPCADARENPILKSGCRAYGPGHQAIVRDRDGDTWLLYHAWPDVRGAQAQNAKRVLLLDRLAWRDGKPVVNGPTCRPQPAP